MNEVELMYHSAMGPIKEVARILGVPQIRLRRGMKSGQIRYKSGKGRINPTLIVLRDAIEYIGNEYDPSKNYLSIENIYNKFNRKISKRTIYRKLHSGCVRWKKENGLYIICVEDTMGGLW